MVSERFGLLRSRRGLQWLCGFGTKKVWLKKPKHFELARLYICPKAEVMPLTNIGSCENVHSS